MLDLPPPSRIRFPATAFIYKTGWTFQFENKNLELCVWGGGVNRT